MTTIVNEQTLTKPSGRAHEVAKDFLDIYIREAKQNNEVLTVGQLQSKLCRKLQPWTKPENRSFKKCAPVKFDEGRGKDQDDNLMHAVFEIATIFLDETRLEHAQTTECELEVMISTLAGRHAIGYSWHSLHSIDTDLSQRFVDTFTTVLPLMMRLLSFESSIASSFTGAERSLVSLLKHATTVYEPLFGLYFLQASAAEGREFTQRLLTMKPPELEGSGGITYTICKMSGAIDRRTEFLKELSQRVRVSNLKLFCKKSILKSMGSKRRHRAHELPLPEGILDYLLSLRYY